MKSDENGVRYTPLILKVEYSKFSMPNFGDFKVVDFPISD